MTDAPSGTEDTMNGGRPSRAEEIARLCEEKMAANKESIRIVQAIKKIYREKILPIEKKYHLHNLCLPTNGAIEDAEFDARPMVLLLGQYSTGKTSFIRHLLGSDFPGMHIGPEPTSDKYMALIHGNEPKIIKGNTLTVMPELHFFGLSQFGGSFLNHFNGSVTNSPLLNMMHIVDTPGILSGEKQRLSREYEFSKTAKWFADRSDLILLLFDAHKLDISDEFKDVVETIRPHNDDKIRCVLNKADAVEKDQLIRVYGSLLWSMGKLFTTPEVVRVYTGSYWEKPLLHSDFSEMFQKDEDWLMDELIRLPSVSAERKVNAIVKRLRLTIVHICILGYLRHATPSYFGKKSARRKLLDNLEQVFETVRNQYVLSPGDMPNVDEFREKLSLFDDFSVFPIRDSDDIQVIEQVLSHELPAVMKGSTNVSDTPGSTRDSVEYSPLSKPKSMTNGHPKRLFIEEAKSSSSSILTLSLVFLAAFGFVAWYVAENIVVIEDLPVEPHRWVALSIIF